MGVYGPRINHVKWNTAHTKRARAATVRAIACNVVVGTSRERARGDLEIGNVCNQLVRAVVLVA
jgi:hypothetical protein